MQSDNPFSWFTSDIKKDICYLSVLDIVKIAVVLGLPR